MKIVEQQDDGKTRVLFVCIGNSCRSQMAEGFARKYGADVLDAFSAGTAPASIVQPLTKKVMAEKSVDLEGQFPKHYSAFELPSFHTVINMSGWKLPGQLPRDLREWKITDPIRQSEEVYTTVRNEIEQLVMQLILERRKGEMSSGESKARRVAEKPAPAEKSSVQANSAFRMGRRR